MKKKSKTIHWWIFTLILLLIFIILQIPASWLISKFYKNNQNLHNVSGNIWHGQADWRQGSLRAAMNWKIRPQDFLLLRIGAKVHLHSGHSQVSGIVAYGLSKQIQIKNLTGQVAPETLKSFAAWQWPSNAIQLQDIALAYHPQRGFHHAEGQLQWAGGPLVYQYAQRQERMDIPSLKANLSHDQQQLKIDVRDQRDQKMLNMSLDAKLMLDIQLTQRLLLNVPSYQGKAGLDTYVFSSRQPLMKGAR